MEISAYFLRNLNWSANKSKTLSLSFQSLEGRCWRCHPRGWGIEVQRGWFGEKECGDKEIEVGSAKTEVCDC